MDISSLCGRENPVAQTIHMAMTMKQRLSNSKCLDARQIYAAGAGVFESEIGNQKIELVYTQAPAAVGTACLLAVLVTLGLWNVVEHSWLLMWLGAQFIQTVARLWLVYRYHRASIAQRKNASWAILFLTGTLLSGIVWGSIGLIFQFSWPVVYQTLVIMSLAGVLAGAISSYAAMLSVYVAFMVPAILIFAQSMLMHGSSISNSLGLLWILFAGVLMMIARNYNSSVMQSLQLREENHDLLQETAAINMALEHEARSRQHAQDQLLRERQLFTEGPVTMFRWAATAGRPVEYVSEAVSQFGYDSKELVQEGKRYIEIIHPNDIQRFTESEMERGEDGVQFAAIDYRIVCGNGDVRWVYDYTVPVHNAEGKLTHYAGYILDITGRKHDEYELNKARERAQVTLHSIADAVITTDVNGQIEYLNPSAAMLTGWDSEIARGLPIQRITI